MGVTLVDADELTHPVGTEESWNESRYLDFWDRRTRVGGWFRIGNRPNVGWAEVSAGVNLPNGQSAFMFSRPTITGNGLRAGDQAWEIVEPWRTTKVTYDGDLLVLPDPWVLTEPKRAFAESLRVAAHIELTCVTEGLAAVMGADQEHIDRIFLPGQAAFHYQHLARTEGTVRVGDLTWEVDGRGGKDHSWGPRDWHAKRYLRWLIATADDGTGFMLTRAVGPTRQTRGGFVWADGTLHLVDDFAMRNEYAPAPHHELRGVEVTIRSGGRSWSAVGTPRDWLPLRHRQRDAAGDIAVLRIVKSPTDWELGDGRIAVGMCEYHDLLDGEGQPVGLHD